MALADVARHCCPARRPGPPGQPDRHGRGHHRPPRGRGGAAVCRGQIHHRLPDAARPGRHHPHCRRALHRREPGFLRAAGLQARGCSGPHVVRAAGLGQRARTQTAAGDLPARGQGGPVAPGRAKQRGAGAGPHVGTLCACEWRKLLCFRFPRHGRSPTHQRRTSGAVPPVAASRPPGPAGRVGRRARAGPGVLVGRVF